MGEVQSTCVGIMCGSSLDAIDVAWLQGRNLRHFSVHPLAPRLRERLQRPLAGDRLAAAEIASLDVDVSRSFVNAVRRSGSGLIPDLVACHGVTVGHDPRMGYSWQLGDLATLCRGLGATVVGHFRGQDIAGGGQGAPLAPLFHRVMFGDPDESRLVANLGGIANLSELSAGGPIRGYDIGPCNLLLDGLYRRLHNNEGDYDGDGKIAASGAPRPDLLPPFFAHPFLQAPPPKSTGREDFGEAFVVAFREACRGVRLSSADTLRTACRFVATNLAEHIRRAPRPDGGWGRLILCGGGIHNAPLVRDIQEAAGPLQVESSAAHGFDPDAVEAAGFALLGLDAIAGRSQSLEAITGGPNHPILGQIQPGPGYRKLLTRTSNG